MPISTFRPAWIFETRLFAKTNAPALLRREFARRGYTPSPIALGINTDAYQPLERRLQLTRKLIEVMQECRHPFSLITKNALVERDLDLLQPLAAQHLVRVHFSVTTPPRTCPPGSSHARRRPTRACERCVACTRRACRSGCSSRRPFRG